MAICARNILSLCAGVGGLELGIMLALHGRGEASRGICYVEREASAAASLVASMEAGWLHPAPVWSDLATFDARPWRGLVHILASGDPCQDNSVAGKRAGAEGERFLAPEVVRVADECRPDLIFRENVPGNLAEQLTAIAPPLEGMGYRIAAGIFSSAETGNTMRRERAFIMACPRHAEPSGWLASETNDDRRGSARIPERHQPASRSGAVACSSGAGQHEHAQLDGEPEQPEQHAFDRRHALRCGDEVGGAISRGDGRVAHDAGRRPLGRIVADRTGDAGLGNVGRADGIGRRAKGHVSGAPKDALQPGRCLPPAIIPGPTDSRWIDVLDRWPELQPALSQEEAESHLRRGIDAMAHRVERLRATGNGVDPVVAAYAFLRLSALLAEARGTGETVVRLAA